MNVFSVDELGSIFAGALAEVISKVSGFSLEVLSSEHDSGAAGMTGLMGLNGKKHGMLFISADESSMRRLCSFMTGAGMNEITKDDMEDALCEIVNMTAGNVKPRLGGGDYMFALSTPFVVRGENMTIIAKKRTHIISRTLSGGEILIKLKLLY